MALNVLTVCYLIGSVTFILGLKMLSGPASARRGNLVAAAGMAIAILGTIFLYKDEEGNGLHNYAWIFAGIAIGAVAGTLAAKKVKMTAMPEMVSLFNGMGGACAALISIVEFNHFGLNAQSAMPDGSKATLLIILSGLIIGSVSFAGSVIAWGKLNGRIKDYAFKGQHIFNLILLACALLLVAWIIAAPPLDILSLVFYRTLVFALLYGIFFVLPIGVADMPVIISLLNSFTSVAAACGGFL